jgi:DNA-binding winged helix-turn-helix (wHTH) protein
MVQMTSENSTDAQAEAQSELRFGPFRLEAAKQLWQGDQLMNLRRQSLATLRYLAERPHQLVTKEELLKQLWPGIYVSSTVVKVCVREIRQALGDEAAKPQFVETVGVKGYRFIKHVNSSQYPVAGSQQAGGNQQPRQTSAGQPPIDHWQLTPYFVGREHELAWLCLMPHSLGHSS